MTTTAGAADDILRAGALRTYTRALLAALKVGESVPLTRRRQSHNAAAPVAALRSIHDWLRGGSRRQRCTLHVSNTDACRASAKPMSVPSRLPHL